MYLNSNIACLNPFNNKYIQILKYWSDNKIV